MDQNQNPGLDPETAALVAACEASRLALIAAHEAADAAFARGDFSDALPGVEAAYRRAHPETPVL